MSPLPLQSPASVWQRLRGSVVGTLATGFLFVSLLLFNLAQTASLLLRLFSARTFRSFNRWAANTWWGWCVISSERLQRVSIILSGDSVPVAENAIVIANHQEMPDITFLMIWARRQRRLGDMKWIVKNAMKYVPGAGWGMAFLDCVFVKRNWDQDRASIERAFARLTKNRVPVWLLSFPEGTRLTLAKLERSQRHATERGLPKPEHVLVPRTKGFVAAVRGLGDHVAAVYDVTIGYAQGVPTLWQYIRGYAKVAHLHVRRLPISNLPADDNAIAEWLRARFRDKDRLLEYFYRHGVFPAALDELPSAI